MSWKKVGTYLLVILIIGMFVFGSLSGLAAASSTNAIKLEIPKVTKVIDDSPETQDVKRTGNNEWAFEEGVLTLDDDIRYRWEDAFLDLAYQVSPAPRAGWLKVYRGDDSTEENLIAEFGSSPLPIARLAESLEEGPNTLLFVYIDSTTKAPAVPATKVEFDFEFKNISTKPRLEVLSPKAGVVLAGGVNQEFKIKLNNFSLTSSTKPEEKTGKLNIYQNAVAQENLIATVNNSVQREENEYFVTFNSRDIEFDQIPDSNEVKLIFALTNVTGDPLEYRDELLVKTNYDGSIDVGLPRVNILEPTDGRLDLTVDGNKKFVLGVENFEILDNFEAGAEVNGKQGYLQIFVDNMPVRDLWASPEFSFNEIGYTGDSGQKEVRVQLVNPDYTKLAPEAVDEVTVVYVPQESNEEEASEETGESNQWRVVIIALVVVMIVGGILLLVLKG